MSTEYEIARNFCYEGNIRTIQPMGSGHINKTYVVTTDICKYTLQKINTSIFKDPDGLMENIYNVTEFLKNKIKIRGGDIDRETLSVIKTIDGKLAYIDSNTDYWRSYLYIDDVITYQEPENLAVIYESGYAFGDFLNMLSDYDMSTLNETIIGFHDTVKRFNDFKEAVNNDVANRAVYVAEEIEFLFKRENDCKVILDRIADNTISLRVTHNDTKLNNLLFDKKTNKPICILDLDTVMPGTILYDYGDALRISGSSSAEDEKDIEKVKFKIDNFEAFTKGFLSAMKNSISQCEISLLPFSIKLITMEIGMRFLTDYLNNDIYFSIHRKNHNLDRARTQFKLVADIESKIELMNKIVFEIMKEEA